uniref:Beta-hexosaminidase n=1 Tax=Cacopsylla melanoneura TaxID=428564 RepID=A0A8D8STP9_9HEMI
MAIRHHLGGTLALCLVCVLADNINFPTRQVKNSSLGEVWPKPQSQEKKNEYVGMLDSFSLKVVGKSCDILDDAIERYSKIWKTNWRNLTKYDLVNTAPNIVGKTTKLKIKLTSDCEKYPHLNMDEKYSLVIKGPSSKLESKSIWGILRGLETFSQLPVPSPTGNELIIQVQKIEDFPRFPHRGLLIDTSRHYLPVKTIKKQLDIMSYNKMNVLHWHIIDDQSFPYESKKFPELSKKGAFGPNAVYTENMIQSIVDYARFRGIRVIPEFDTPAHTDSMEPGRPDVHCHHQIEGRGPFIGPMDPTKNATIEFARGLFTEVAGRFPENYIHLGGDEVDSFCWENNPKIKKFLADRNWSVSQLQSYYMQKVLNIVKNVTKNAIVWEEVFMNWMNMEGNTSEQTEKITMDKDTIVQLWKGSTPTGSEFSIKKVVAAGYKVISSVGWYLDSLNTDFEEYYNINFDGLSLTETEQKLVMGGEACMWGEKADETNIESRVWVRACAAAERLWSAPLNNISDTTYRITEHVCRLRRRGVAAAPAHDISYCSPTIEHESSGSFGLRFFSMTHLRESLGLDNDDDDDNEKLVYKTVTPDSLNHVNGVVGVSHTGPAEAVHPESATLHAPNNNTATLSRVEKGLLVATVGVIVLAQNIM